MGMHMAFVGEAADLMHSGVRPGDQIKETRIFDVTALLADGALVTAGAVLDSRAVTYEVIKGEAPPAEPGDVRMHRKTGDFWIRTHSTDPDDYRWVGFSGRSVGEGVWSDRLAEFERQLVLP